MLRFYHNFDELLIFEVFLFLLITTKKKIKRREVQYVSNYLYYFEGTDILGKFFGMGIVGSGKVAQASVDIAAEGTKDTVNVAQEVTRDVTDKVEEVGQKIENRADNRVGKAIEGPDNLNSNDNTRADLSTESEIQQPKQSGYCYIGTDRTFRSCVKMNSGDTCASKQVFPTKDICINPTLRK